MLYALAEGICLKEIGSRATSTIKSFPNPAVDGAIRT
jgi:hypothetical protein